MKFTNLLIAISLSLTSLSVMAGLGEVEGRTTCTDIEPVAKKVLETSGCYYSGSIGASNSYAITELDFILDNSDNFSIVDNVWFEHDKKGKVINKKTVVTYSGLKAKTVMLKVKTLKEVSKQEIEKRNKQPNPKFSDVLYCYKIIEKGHDAATCVPYDLILKISQYSQYRTDDKPIRFKVIVDKERL